jgi:hypothetical protein
MRKLQFANNLQTQRIRSGVERPKNIMTEFNVAFRIHCDLFVVVDNAQRSKLLSRPKIAKRQSIAFGWDAARFSLWKHTHMIKRNRVVITSCSRSPRRGRREGRNLACAASPTGRRRQRNHD